MRDRIRSLLSTINYNFKNKVWKQTDINLAMDEIDEDIVSLAQKRYPATIHSNIEK